MKFQAKPDYLAIGIVLLAANVCCAQDILFPDRQFAPAPHLSGSPPPFNSVVAPSSLVDHTGRLAAYPYSPPPNVPAFRRPAGVFPTRQVAAESGPVGPPASPPVLPSSAPSLPPAAAPPAPGALQLLPQVVSPAPQAGPYANAFQPLGIDFGGGDASLFSGQFSTGARPFNIGVDFYSPPDFKDGLIIFGPSVAMKIGGYVKADFIYDFDPIDSTDSFVTTEIPVGAAPRTNSRFHARQTRLSFDTRWVADEQTVRIYVESDFFSDGNQFRLRQAYGESGPLLVGQTWSTFSDVGAAPSTLDFEGSVSSVNRRQAQARWTTSVLHDYVTLALAVEDTRFIIEVPDDVDGVARSPSPDFVGRARLELERARFQFAGLYRIVGFQVVGGDVTTRPAWGINITNVFLVTDATKVYSQIVFGEGIGSYRSLPDAAPSASDGGALLPLFGWMVGVTRDWNDDFSSNFTYAENSLDNTPLQAGDEVHHTTYLAANLIWSPLDRVRLGIEYLYGLRENVDRGVGAASRLQCAFIFDLP